MFSTFVPGTPTPQGSKRAFVVRGRAVVAESAGQKLKTWRATIGQTIDQQLDTVRDISTEPVTDPVHIKLEFYIAAPKQAPPSHRWHRKRPDLDKLIRAVLDELSGRLIVDDSQVASIIATKELERNGRTGVRINLTRLKDL